MSRPYTDLTLSEQSHYQSITGSVLDEIGQERLRQDRKWGVDRQFPNGTHYDAEFAREMADKLKERLRNASRTGTTSWADILEEEFWEALAETDKAAIRKELVQVAAVAVAWIEAIDRQ